MMNMAIETTRFLRSEDNDSRLEAGRFESLGDEVIRVGGLVTGHGDKIDSLKLEDGELKLENTRLKVEVGSSNLEISRQGNENNSLKLETVSSNAKIIRQGDEVTRLNLKMTQQGADIIRLKDENGKLKPENVKLKLVIDCLKLVNLSSNTTINSLNVKIDWLTLKT